MTSLSAAPAERKRRSGQYATTLAAWSVLFVSSPTHAQGPERVELTWQAPAGCPSAAEVRARIHQLVGATTANGSRLRARAVVTRNPDGRFHLRLLVEMDEVTGERHIEGRSCVDLAGAAAVNIVLLLGSAPPSDASSAEPDSEGAAPVSLQPSAAEAEPELDQAQPLATRGEPHDESSAREWRVLLRLPIAALGLGPLPRPSVGLALGAGLELGNWSILAETAAWLQQTVQATRAGVGIDITHVDASLRTCRTFAWGMFEVAPCVRVSLRHIWARGAGAHVSARTAESTWIAPGMGAQLALPVSDWLKLFAVGDAQLETARPRVSIDGVGPVSQLAPASVSFAVGAEWSL